MAVTERILLLSFFLLGVTNGYEVGKDYVYVYDGKLQVTQPEVKTQSVGLAFRSKVVVQPRAAHTHFKVLDFEADVVNADVIDFSTHEFHYESHPALVENVERTFAAKFTNGKFENIEMAKDEPLWSQNVKKALVSLFQVDLTAHRENPHVKGYTVLEDGINGVCETLYVLSPDARHAHGTQNEHVGRGETSVHEEDGEHAVHDAAEDQSVHYGTHEFRAEVTKVRNLQKCTNSPVAFLGSFRGQQCGDCVSRDIPPFVSTAEVKYGLRGTPHGFVIEHACSSASQVYVPFNEGKVVTVFVNRTLRLIEEKETTTDTALPEELEVHSTLAHVFPVTKDARTPEDLKRRNRFTEVMHLSTDSQKFLQMFNDLAQTDFTEGDYKDGLHKDSAAEKFLRAFHAFATFTYEGIGEFYENVVKGPEQEKQPSRSVFLDLLGAAGTNPHVAFGLHLIQSGQLSVPEAERFLSKLPFNVKEPSEAVAHAIIDTCKTDFVKADDHLKGSCLLAVGSLIEHSCDRAKTDEQTDGRLCHPDIVERFFNYSLTYEEVQHQKFQLSAVYAEIAAKLGTRNAIRSLARYVGHQVRCPRLRVASLYALALAGYRQSHMARQVAQVALPIYKNTSESYEVRIAAFVAVVSTNPDLYLLRHIARTLIDDPSDQLASYVTSYFREFAKSNYPCHRSMARKFKYVVPLWDNVRRFRKPLDYTKSRVSVSSGYDPKYNYGGMTMTSVIRSEDSDLPRSFYVGAKDYFAGFSHDSVSIRYQGWGVDKVLAQLYGPGPGSKRNLWGIHGRRRLRRDTNERKKIEDSLPITPRTYPPFSANIQVAVFGHTIHSLEVNEKHLEFLKQPPQPGRTPADLLMHLLGGEHKSKHYYLSRDMIWFFPTDLGFVLFLDVKRANFIYAKRHQATFQHSDDKCQFGYQRHYMYDSSAYEVLGVGLTFRKTSFGAGYYKRTAVSLPLNLHAAYDIKKHKLRVEKPLTLPVDLLNYKFQPYTFIEGFDNTVPPTNPVAEFPHNTLPLYRNEELKDYERTYFADALGFGLHVKSQLIKKGLLDGLHRFWHDMDWRRRFYYLYVNPHWYPRTLTIEAVPAENHPTHSMELDLGYGFHHSDDAMGHGSVSDAESAPTVDPNAVVHVVNVDVHLKGPTKNRSLSTKLTYSHSNDVLQHHVTFFYDRTPFLQREENHTKVCLDTTAAFPRPEWAKLTNLGGFYQGKTIDVTASVAYGEDCATGSRISAHGTYQHTDADAEEIESVVGDRPNGNDRFKQNTLQTIYRKCRLDQQRGIELSYYCIRYLYHSSRLGKLNLDVEYHNLRPLLPRLYHVYQEHNKGHAGFFDIVASHFSGPDGRLHVVSQVPGFQQGRYADVTVTVPPNETGTSPLHDRVYRHEGVPTFSHLLEPRIFYHLGYSNLEEYSARFKHKTCDLQGDAVLTFDGVVVPLPETHCYKVVARDCSPDSQFVILAKELPSSAFSKALKMFVGDAKVEILPPVNGSGPVFKVDGHRVDVTFDQPYSHQLDGAELFYAHVTDQWYLISSNTRGFHVLFSGHSLFVQAAPFYRGKLCGLCGDYNFERQNELRGPDLRLYDDPLAFARSYVVPSEDCTV